MMNREAHMNSWLRVTFDQMQQTGVGETGEGVLLDIFFNRHSRERGNPVYSELLWMPAGAGMTNDFFQKKQ